MIFAIDVGNSNIVIGCCDGDKIIFRERISTNHTATVLEYVTIFKTAFDIHNIECTKISGSIISSVVPSVTEILKNACNQLINSDVIVIGPGVKTGINILIDNPAQLGSDLVVDAVAGSTIYPLPLIIVDLGTATTISVIDKDKNYLGGMILPGIAVSRNALIGKTSQLPMVALEKPKKLIGTNTVECIKSGICYGNASALDGIIERITEEIGKCTVVATGGLAGTIVPLCKNDIIVDDDLLLKGLMLIYNKNK